MQGLGRDAGLVSHTLRKTVVSYLDDNEVSARKVSDQLGHKEVSTTQDRYLGRRLTDRQTAEALEGPEGSNPQPAESRSAPRDVARCCSMCRMTCTGVGDEGLLHGHRHPSLRVDSGG
jgi:hypothetical protein